MPKLWEVSYDIAAVVILIMLFLWYVNEKRIPLRSHRVFVVMLAVVLAATVLEIYVAGYVDKVQNLNDMGFKWLFSIKTMLNCLVSVVFVWYAIVLSDLHRNPTNIYKKIITGVAVLLVILNMLNPVTDWAYGFDGNRFTSYWAGYVLCGLVVLLIFGALVIMHKNLKDITFVKASALAVNMMFILFCYLIQIQYNIHILNFSISVGCLTMYQYLNNPGAMTDETTKVFNRNLLGVCLKNEFSAGKRFSVIVVAMDDFKFINKTYGVNVGDQMLRQIASYLVSVRNSDMVFRFGSDQFCMVIRKDTKDVHNIAHKIEERFKHPWYSDSSAGIMMSASICCISCPDDADSYGNLIEVIDYSMLVAKKTRKGGISDAEHLMLDALREDKSIEKAVKLAMDRDELMVYYQPIYSVSQGKYNSAEALVRIKDSELGWISPEKFIPIAEKNGLIVEMGDMILEKVCRFIRDFNLKDTCIEYIEVNISPVQLVQADFVDRVKHILEKYDVSPSQINMEITETATLSGAAIVTDNINRLVEYGINFSLDDYGSGNANIDYINNMPFSLIKIDKFIVWDAFKNEKAGITLEYTVGMLNALKLHIVAEGVETEEMKEHLKKVGCHYMQGWYYSKAVSDEEFIKLVS